MPSTVVAVAQSCSTVFTAMALLLQEARFLLPLRFAVLPLKLFLTAVTQDIKQLALESVGLVKHSG